MDEATQAGGDACGLLDLIRSWDLNQTSMVSLREFYQALVLLGIYPEPAPVQLLFDEIAGGAYKLTFDAVVEWVKTRTEQAAGAVL